MQASVVRRCITWAAITMVIGPLPARAATPEAEARRLVKRITSMKDTAQLPPLLTNETAAGMGVLFGVMLGMTGAMAEAMTGAVEGMADAMGNAMGSTTGDPVADPMGDAIGDGIVGENPKPARVTKKPPTAARKTPAAAKFATITTDIERVFRKHGVPTDNSAKSLTPQQRARIVSSGRALLADVIRIMDKLPESKGGGTKGIMPNKDIRPEKLKYRRISATRVQIVDPSEPKARIEARLEGGGWRLHMLDAAQILDGKGRSRP